MNSQVKLFRVCALTALTLCTADVLADSVVHDTSTEFAGGTFSDTIDVGSGNSPQIRVIYESLPFGFGDDRNGSPTISGAPNARSSCSGFRGGNDVDHEHDGQRRRYRAEPLHPRPTGRFRSDWSRDPRCGLM